MSQCVMCFRKSTKQRIIDRHTNICTECKKKIAIIDASNNKPSDGMNEYLACSNHDSTNSMQELQDNNDRMNKDCESYISIGTDLNLTKSQNTNTNDETFVLTEETLKKPMSEVSVQDILKINAHSNKSIEAKLDTFISHANIKLENMNKRMEFLEAENTKKDDENAVLKDIIVNMQSCLNKSDSDKRNKNVIIQGIPEGKISVENMDLECDLDKIKWLLKLTGNEYFNNETINNLDISRLGKPKHGYNRTIKIICQSNVEREAFLKGANKLKNLAKPWRKVYIKKDQHPVYIGENNRLRRKMNELKKIPGNANRVIKIINGKLLIDDIKVDENTFFH